MGDSEALLQQVLTSPPDAHRNLAESSEPLPPPEAPCTLQAGDT